MKKYFKKYWYIIIIAVLLISNIALVVTTKYIYKYHYNALPSKADLEYGLKSTFKQIDNINCEFYDKVKYSNIVYKYTCNIDYTFEGNEVKDYETCVDCFIKGKKWQCSISTKKCFK